ncbi:MAG: Bax inhibitor-1 family protein [bacterium]|nr:Bax inhibitor-1 family protein [bacterium]
MEERNPYAEMAAPVAAFAAASERAAFLKRVYSYLFLGILGFAATLWAAGNVAPVRDLMLDLWGLIAGTKFGILIYMGLFWGGSWLVNRLAETRPINAIAYASWAFLLGLLVAPLVLIAGPETVTLASALTAGIFGSLTAYVLWTGKDFSFIRGALLLGGLVVFGAFIAGFFFHAPWLHVAISAGIVALCAGYILYYTSHILHHLPTTMAMTGAILLFTEVVLLFKHILLLLMRARD